MPGQHVVKRVIVVAASPRTGSTLLSEALTATGLAGETQEYVNPSLLLKDRYGVGPVRYSLRGHAGRLRRRIARDPHWDQPVPEHFTNASVAAVLRRIEKCSLSPDGVLSLKVMWDDYNRVMLRRGFDASFWGAPVSWVWIHRNDRLRQAVSFTKALQTQQWHDRDDPAEMEPHYDRSMIERCISIGDRDEAGWRNHFASRPISPLEVTYEELDANYEATMARVFAHVGLDVDRVPAPPLQRMADAVTEEWVRRYRKEHPV
jgi:LPS sulfotransferase NodH